MDGTRIVESEDSIQKKDKFMGDPKTKFLLLFLSAVRPSVRPKKTSPDFAPVRPPTSDLGPILTNVPSTHFIMDDMNNRRLDGRMADGVQMEVFTSL